MHLYWAFTLAMFLSVATSSDGAPLEPVATISMPGVKGRIDHLAVDVERHRLFVAALGNDSVEVLDTATRRHVKSVPGFGEPQGVLHLPASNRLFVASGRAGRVDVLNGTSLTRIQRISNLPDADNLRYDARSSRVVLGYGDGALRVMESERPDSAWDIRLPGHPESFQLEKSGTRVFVNVPDARQIAVVDRAKGVVSATWSTGNARANFPMALDEAGRRLFVGARTPAILLVYDIERGQSVAELPIGRDTDDIFFDAERKRVYVICGEGRIDVLRQKTPDTYVHETSVKTAPRARTGLFVPEEHRLYVAAPAARATPARILIYETGGSTR
jgi:YVTN family beta-propeller protein